MQSIVEQSAHLRDLAESIVAGLDDSHAALEPAPGIKTAGWLVGHLAVSGDAARRWLGREPSCPPEWSALFLPGTRPSSEASDYPPMATLLERMRSVYPDLAEAMREASPEVLARPNPYVPAREAFPTAGDFAGYILSAHLAYHLGQLVAWRAAAGLEPRRVADRPPA